MIFSHKELTESLHYDPISGFFIWLKHRHISRVGNKAGHTDNLGYRIIGFFYKSHKAHRLAWFYVYGRWPNSDLDHINGNPGDNRIKNLREATESQNLANSRISIRNKSGRKGVCWAKRQKRWKAQIKVGSKVFGLGYFRDIESAAKAYADAAKLHFGDFARIA